MFKSIDSRKAQIALEFLIVYSFVLIVFILVFSVITLQRAATLGQQQYSLLQLQSQNVASYIDQAVQAGTGYSATVPLISGIARDSYSLNISSTGVVIARTDVGGQRIVAYGFSNPENLVINGSINSSASSNGINLYMIPAYRGSITISNLRGTIYIDEIPPSVSSLAEGAVVSQQADVKAASFNSVKDNYIIVNNSAGLTLGSSFSVYLWFDENGCGTILGKSNSLKGFAINVIQCPATYNSNGIIDFSYGGTQLTAVFPSIGWINAVATFDGTNGILTWYINGNRAASYNGLRSISQNSNTLYIGNGDSAFSGSIANIQVYNGILTPSQVASLYINGIGSMPVNPNLVGWWPLNGNPNDYSGLGNQGTPVNGIGYADVIQLNARVYSFSGNGLANSLVGFVTSEGYLSSNAMYSSVYSSGNGLATAFVTDSNSQGFGNVVSEIFNANSTASGNLIGWWPLDLGYGSSIQDLSNGRNPGSFSGIWTQYVNQTNFVAQNIPYPFSCSGGKRGSIAINSSNIVPNVVNNNTFTIVAWLNSRGPTYPNSQGIFGSWNNNVGLQFNAYCGSGPSTLLYVGGSTLRVNNCNNFLASNSWQMVVAQYDGYTGATKIYLNGTVFATAILPQNLNLNNTGAYQISNDTAGMISGDVSGFNGEMTNLQFYDSYLTPQQIDSLYDAGLTSTPLDNSGLLGWWPLLNNTLDYSYNMDNGTVTGCNGIISYVNSVYNNTAEQIGPGFATFNGFSNAIIPYTSTLATANSIFTVSFWFSSFNGYTSTFDQSLINVETPLGGSSNNFDVSLCGNSSCGLTGIQGGVGTGSGWLSESVNYPFSFRRNVWYNVIEVFNSTGWTMYLNGNKAGSGTYSGTPRLLGNGDTINLGSGSGIANFTGQMANLQVYNSALTPQQAMQLYVQGLPVQYRNNISIG